MIAYLAEPSNLTNTGKIKGKTLRCYEVELAEETTSYDKHITRTYHRPTGFMYTLKGNKIIKQKTTASLLEKFIPYNNQIVHTSIDKHLTYGSSYYASPELAILGKLNNLQKDYYLKQQALQDALEQLKFAKPYIDQFQTLASTYPELVI